MTRIVLTVDFAASGSGGGGFSTMHGAKLRDWEVSLQGVRVHRKNAAKSA